MKNAPFGLLYRQFLFRVIDLEILAPKGDVSRLLGQFAALLITVSFWVLLPPVAVVGTPPSEVALMFTWAAEHFLIATTMLVIGLFALMSWESMFPDRRDVMILIPLPLRTRTIFLAKAAAIATALSLALICLNLFPGIAAPFAFSRALTLAPAKYDAAIAPISGAELKPVLDRDMLAAKAPGSNTLALGANAGIAIGVVQHGAQCVFTYGAANGDSIFQIGSITKTFTGLLLAQLSVEGRVRLDEPVRELLPKGTVTKPTGDEITLLDIATQHSGLPAMPDNFKPQDLSDPYADYHALNLYGYMAKRGVGRPPHPRFLYSNLGLGLLGQALVVRAGTSYGNLLREEITEPLGMRDTAVSLSPEQKPRLIQGYSGNHRDESVPAWHLDALAGAGAIDSTAGDMLKYLEAQLHPERAGKLSAALAESHRIWADVFGHQRIALAWFHDDESDIYFHNGATAGYQSYAFFSPKRDCAAVVLMNVGPNLILSADQLGEHIRERLAGQRAVSLSRPVVAGRTGFLRAVRSFAAYWIALFAGGTFVFCFVLSLQGLAQLLPRQIFLRVSSYLQVTCFCLFLTVYFLQPPFAGPDALAYNPSMLSWLPSYCFFSLFQALNGPLPSMLVPLVHRAWIALGASICGAAGAYLICHFRTLHKIAEEPDILPGTRGLRWLPQFGTSLQTAIAQFAVRPLFRSRQHRVVLSFYLGIALGLAIFISRVPVIQSSASETWYRFDSALLVSSTLILCSAVIGTRILFSIPLEVRANWMFRIIPPIGAEASVSASRRALCTLSLVPVWLAMAALFFWLWPWRIAAGHLAVLGLLGMITAELSLRGFHKIPFTCSYVPGKSYFHMAGLAAVALIFGMSKGAILERNALENPLEYLAMVSTLAAVGAFLRWRTSSRARTETGVRFEEEVQPAIQGLNL